MTEIAVLKRSGHEVVDDVNEGLTYLCHAGIGARAGQEEQGYGLIRIHESSDVRAAKELLLEHGLDVVEKPD